jgi:glycosyltransferase involved in cell wall biosynthesis
MFGVLGTWMEADVVGATVQNALTQGCERVYLVDNGSTDGTVEAATAAGAILVRFYATDKYDEELRLQQMNEVVAEVSAREDSAHIWWLYLDADEFAHGPWGMTLRAYLETLDERFRAVGTRYFNHYPSTQPYYISDRHPLDFQPLCEELAYPMCPSSHRKHPLLRYDRDGVGIRAGKGFHIAHADELLYEPADPAFLHHFPFRDEEVTRRRLRTLWEMNQAGHSRALETRDTHMLARARSLDAVYRQDWKTVYNFAPLDPMRSSLSAVPPQGVDVKPWGECVQSEHQHVPRWYPMVGAWRYEELQPFMYGDDTTYGKGLAFLDGHGTIEDWGSGFGHAKQFIRHSPYVGVDGSSPHADKQVDLRDHTSSVDCIFMRHVLEHNTDWRRILTNAVASFKKRMVIVIFTPFAETTHQIATSTVVTSIPVPDISFKKEDLSAYSRVSAGLRKRYTRSHSTDSSTSSTSSARSPSMLRLRRQP